MKPLLLEHIRPEIVNLVSGARFKDIGAVGGLPLSHQAGAGGESDGLEDAQKTLELGVLDAGKQRNAADKFG